MRRLEGPALAMIETKYRAQRYNLTDQDSLSNSAMASLRSAVSKLSMNQP